MAKTPNYLLWAVAFVVVAVVVWQLSAYFVSSESCAAGESVAAYCSGLREVSSRVCEGGRWVDTVEESCGSLQSCEHGLCLDVVCSGDAAVSQCSSEFTVVRQECVGGVFQNSLRVCGNTQYCKDTGCVNRPDACGDFVCQGSETVENCPRDCGKLSSWDEYYRSVASDENMTQFLYCGGDVDCDDPAVESAVQAIEAKYHPATPYEWINAATYWTHNWISYEVGGSKGLKASDLVELRQVQGFVEGNCAQYSLLELAVLRRKGIAAVQYAGCVSHSNPTCSMYSALSMDLQVGYLNGVTDQSSQSYEPLAHSYLKVWTGEKWVLVDPTINQAASNCVGYFDVSTGGLPDKEFQYTIKDYFALQECRAF